MQKIERSTIKSSGKIPIAWQNLHCTNPCKTCSQYASKNGSIFYADERKKNERKLKTLVHSMDVRWLAGHCCIFSLSMPPGGNI